MIGETEARRRIETWLHDEIEIRASDRLVDESRRRVGATRQRRRGLRSLWTDRSMSGWVGGFAAGSAVAAAIAVAVLALAYRPGPGTGGAGSSQAAATAPPSTPMPVGPLPAGRYTTYAFQPRLTYTVPEGWRLAADSRELGLALEASGPDSNRIDVCLGPVASEPRTNLAAGGVGRSADALIAHLQGRSDYRILDGPVGLAIDGFEVRYLDIEGLPDAPELALLAGGPAVSTCGANLYGTERLRLGFVDLPDGQTLAIVVKTFAGWEAIESHWRIVTSFAFDREP